MSSNPQGPHQAHVGTVFQSTMTTQGKLTSGDEVRVLTEGREVLCPEVGILL